MNSYQQALEDRKQQLLFRDLSLLPTGIDFYSNDYLGLSQSIELKDIIAKEAKRPSFQNGATGSRLLSGNTPYSEEVEKQIAAFHNTEDALIYPTGYMANLGLISSLATKETTLICDELIHASLIDGARLGLSKKVRFKHNDLESLASKLSKTKGQKLVIVESVYSMDGDICPLKEVVALCEKHDAMLIVDEAHSIGIFGEYGSGLVQELGLEKNVMARIMTYGKAPGIHGAAVVGPKWLKEYQTNFSRSFIFSTAPPPHQFASIAALYSYLPQVEKRRVRLLELIAYFVQKRCLHHGHWLMSRTQIQSLIIPGNENVINTADKLKKAGVNIMPIREPSVASGLERIRFCLHSFNTKEEIDHLFKVL